MEKTLRYLLMTIEILGVLSVNAQTHQYGATHEQAAFTSVQVNPQMPSATMDWHSDYMTTGSHLPQAALEGTYTTYDQGNSSSGGHKGHIRTAGPGQTGGGGPDDREDPYGDPIGDAAIPLALLACVYACARAFRRKRA